MNESAVDRWAARLSTTREECLLNTLEYGNNLKVLAPIKKYNNFFTGSKGTYGIILPLMLHRHSNIDL